MQGPHQVAQKSSTMILPLRFFNSRAFEFIQLLSCRAGAGLPCMVFRDSRTLLFSRVGSTALRFKERSNDAIRENILFMSSV